MDYPDRPLRLRIDICSEGCGDYLVLNLALKKSKSHP